MKPPPEFTPPNIHTLPKRNNAVVWVLGGICVFGCCMCGPILGAILFPVFSQARLAAQRTVCLSNLKQIGLAGLMYADDSDDRFPKADGWDDHLQPYTKNKQLYRCPLVKNGFGYAMNDRCSLAKTTEMKDPKSVVFVFDSADLGWNAHSASLNFPAPPRHGSPNAVYADGHAMRIKTGGQERVNGEH